VAIGQRLVPDPVGDHHCLQERHSRRHGQPAAAVDPLEDRLDEREIARVLLDVVHEDGRVEANRAAAQVLGQSHVARSAATWAAPSRCCSAVEEPEYRGAVAAVDDVDPDGEELAIKGGVDFGQAAGLLSCPRQLAAAVGDFRRRLG